MLGCRDFPAQRIIPFGLKTVNIVDSYESVYDNPTGVHPYQLAIAMPSGRGLGWSGQQLRNILIIYSERIYFRIERRGSAPPEGEFAPFRSDGKSISLFIHLCPNGARPAVSPIRKDLPGIFAPLRRCTNQSAPGRIGRAQAVGPPDFRVESITAGAIFHLCDDRLEANGSSFPWIDIAPAGISGTSPWASMLQLLAMRLPPAVRQKNADSSMISALL